MAAYHRGDLADQITAACLEDIRAHGELTLSIRKLSDQLGVSHNALYHHFKGKKALIAHLAGAGFALLAKALSEGDDDASIEAFGLRYFRFFREEPQLYRFMFTHVAANRDGAARTAFQQLLSRVGDSTTAAYHHWSLVHGLCTLMSTGAFSQAQLTDKDIEQKVLAILSAGKAPC